MPLMEIADVNRDAMVDLVFLQPDGELVVLYNQYKAEGPKSKNLCSDEVPASTLKTDPFYVSYPFTGTT